MKDGPTVIESYRRDDDEPYIILDYRLSAVIDAPTIRILNYPNTSIGIMMCAIFNEQNKGGDTVARVYPR